MRQGQDGHEREKSVLEAGGSLRHNEKTGGIIAASPRGDGYLLVITSWDGWR
jgi:hypothetical protein